MASFHAIQPSRAHLIRAGYLATPGERHGVAEHVLVRLGSAAGLHQLDERRADLHRLADWPPITRSASTDTLAWLIEQPSAS